MPPRRRAPVSRMRRQTTPTPAPNQPNRGSSAFQGATNETDPATSSVAGSPSPPPRPRFLSSEEVQFSPESSDVELQDPVTHSPAREDETRAPPAGRSQSVATNARDEPLESGRGNKRKRVEGSSARSRLSLPSVNPFAAYKPTPRPPFPGQQTPTAARAEPIINNSRIVEALREQARIIEENLVAALAEIGNLQEIEENLVAALADIGNLQDEIDSLIKDLEKLNESAPKTRGRK